MKLTVDQMTLICGFLEEMMDNVTEHAEGCAAIDDEGERTGARCNADDDASHGGYVLDCQLNGGDFVEHVAFQIDQLKNDIAQATKTPRRR